MKKINHIEYPKRLKKLSIETLLYIMRDAQEAIKANPKNPNCCYYADEICYCSDEMKRRDKTIIE